MSNITLENTKVKKGYKQTELGIIPEDWEVLRLCDLGTFKNGINKGSEAFGHGSPFVNLMDVFGVVSISSTDSLGLVDTNNTEQQTYDLQKGDVIFIRSSVKPSGVGLTAVVEEDLPKTVYSGFLIRFRDGGALDNGFKRHCFYEEDFRRRVISASSVSANTNINQDNLKRLLLSIPKTKAEQTAIAAALSDADALITSMEQLIAKKRAIKQGAMQELLRPKKGWEVEKLGEIAGIKKGQLITESTRIDGNIPVIAGGKIPAYYHNKANRFGKTITISASGASAGYISFHNYPIFASDCSTIEESKKYSIEFIFYFLSLLQDKIYKMQTGGAQPHIHPGDLIPIIISVPPLSEQIHIATILSDMDAEIEELERKLDKYRRIKQGMMQELLTGRIRLVKPVAEVIQSPEQKKTAPVSAKKPHNWQINEAVVIAVLAKNFGSEQYPLARKRCTKLTYLLHRHVEHKAEGYLKKAAGPYNPQTRYSGPEKIAQDNNYVRSHNNGTYDGFIAFDKINEAQTYFDKWYGTDVLTWLEQFRRTKTDDLELITTIDMAMEDLRGEGKSVSLSAVKQVIEGNPEWKKKLEREVFSDDNIIRAIQTCQKLFAGE